MNATACRKCVRAAADPSVTCREHVPTNTSSAIASIDGDDLATIHASDMADTLGAYARSVALVIDRADLHTLRRVLTETVLTGSDATDVLAALRIRDAITATLDAGLR